MRAVIQPGKLNGTIPAPPSKSYAHRMLISAALTEGKSSLVGIMPSEDMFATMDCIAALGALADYDREALLVRVQGCSHSRVRREENALPVFCCRESGSTLRFFIPIALALCGGGVFTGEKRLIERGIGIYEDLFSTRGIKVEKTETEITVKGSLPAGSWQLKGDVSSQFVTGLLFALSLLNEDSRVEVLPPVESRAYIDITIHAMKQFGVCVEETEPNVFFIKGGQTYQPRDITVEGDWSNAAFLYAFRAVGSDIGITWVNPESMQGDKACVEYLERLKGQSEEGEPFEPIDLSDTPDLGPVLFAAAAAMKGGRFIGTRRLKIKESDRVAAMAEELSKFGVSMCTGENEAEVPFCELQKPSVPLHGHNDHRIVMALAVLCSLTGGEIEGCEAVRKSWPDFFEKMKEHGLRVEITE